MDKKDEIFKHVENSMYAIWSSIGVPAFRRGDVPKGFNKPYIEFSYAVPGKLRKSDVNVKIFTYSTDFDELHELCEMLLKIIPNEGILYELNGSLGKFRICRADNFINEIPDSDNLIKAYKFNYAVTIYADV